MARWTLVLPIQTATFYILFVCNENVYRWIALPLKDASYSLSVLHASINWPVSFLYKWVWIIKHCPAERCARRSGYFTIFKLHLCSISCLEVLCMYLQITGRKSIERNACENPYVHSGKINKQVSKQQQQQQQLNTINNTVSFSGKKEGRFPFFPSLLFFFGGLFSLKGGILLIAVYARMHGLCICIRCIYVLILLLFLQCTYVLCQHWLSDIL